MANVQNDYNELATLRDRLRSTWAGKRLAVKIESDNQDPPFYCWVATFANNEVARSDTFRFTSPGLYTGIEKEFDFTAD
jgi:hypothetical protein